MDGLTPKQEEVIRLMAKGLTNGQIAERMGISLSGAKWHVSEVLSKFGVDSREEAVMLWKAERGLGARLSRMAGAVTIPKLAGGGAAVAAGIGGVFVVAALVFSGGEGGGADDPNLASANVAETPSDAAVESSPMVESGQCDDGPWGRDVPLCQDMEPDEVRYTITLDGAAVEIEGLAGEDLHHANLVFADGLETARPISLPDPSSDGGGSFAIRGSFASPPASLRFDGRDGVLVEHDLTLVINGEDWPEPLDATSAGITHHAPSRIDRDCFTWEIDRSALDICAGDAESGQRMRSGHAEGTAYLIGVFPGDVQSIVGGLDDGTLAELDFIRYTTEAGAQFAAFGATHSEAVTITSITISATGGRTFWDMQPQLARLLGPSSQPPEIHPLAFDDGTIRVAIDADGCVWSSRNEFSQPTRSCGGLQPYRVPQDYPIVSVETWLDHADHIHFHFIVNPQTAAIQFVDDQGNVFSEDAQIIPGSPFDVYSVYFGREFGSEVQSYRAIGHDGEVLETMPFDASDYVPPD